MQEYKILTINPGSTSTKVALFYGDKVLFQMNVSHDSDELLKYKTISDQLAYRRDTIITAMQEENTNLDGIHAVVGRGGGLIAMEGGVYKIDNLLLEHAKSGANGIQHPAQLGPQLADYFADKYDCPAFVVNPPDTDELQPVARMTGVKDVYRNVHLHALNLKETAIRHAKSMNKTYQECNFIVCHIGGGISVSAHRHGFMIDGNDVVGGDGPMAPTRCGSLPAMELIKYCFSGKSEKEILALCTRTGGFVSHLGTSDAHDVIKMRQNGNKIASIVWDAMIYQIAKEIGAMATVLHGRTDGILLGGGIVHSKELVDSLIDACGWIAPVTAYPGEFEMEAMAQGAGRVLRNEEKIKEYTGKPVWNVAELYF